MVEINSKSEALNSKQTTNSKLQISNDISSRLRSNNNLFFEPQARSSEDKKILQSLKKVIESVNSDLNTFRFGQAAQTLYEFVWHEFADVYIEKSKEQLANEKLKESTQNNLLYVLTTSLKLLHPFMPFVTEEIWNKLPVGENLIVAKWPHYAEASRGKPEKSED